MAIVKCVRVLKYMELPSGKANCDFKKPSCYSLKLQVYDRNIAGNGCGFSAREDNSCQMVFRNLPQLMI